MFPAKAKKVMPMALAKPELSAVRAIIGTDLSDPQVQSVIDDAALLAEGCPKVAGYDAGRQAAIVKWLSAHMIASTAKTGVLTQKSLGDASESYGRAQVGLNLSGTTYGQQALALDPSGCLARLGQRSAFVQVL
jgi:hypothetical protein